MQPVTAKPTIEKVSNPHTQLAEPPTLNASPPFQLNAIINYESSEVDIGALVHGIESLEAQVNAITFPETGKQIEFRHLIQSRATKKIWDPAMSTEIDCLVSTATIK